MRVIFIVCVVVLLIGCESSKTVSYYKEHPEEMKTKIKECDNDVNRYAKDGNCANAAAAQQELFFKPAEVDKSYKGPELNLLKDKKQNFSIKKEGLKPSGSNWVPVYDRLRNEIS